MTRRTLMGHTFTECHLFIQPKNGSWRLRTLRLPRGSRGAQGSPEPVEGANGLSPTG